MKRGFTIVELVVVICILSLLFLIAAPSIIKFKESANKKARESKISLIKEGAVVYGNDIKNNITGNCNYSKHSDAKCKTVTLDYLVKNNYIEEEVLIDPTTNQKFNAIIELQYYNNLVHAVFVSVNN